MQHVDGLALAAVVSELRALGEPRIDKVGQPSHGELYLNLRAAGQNHRLYISVQNQFARLHLTRRPLTNLAVPTGFTMQLRKHLEGARLVRVEQVDLERVAVLVVAGRDELGDPYERRLVIELIGKYANLFLVDGGTEKILGCLRPVTEAMCGVRQLAGGLPYDPPPLPSGKCALGALGEADLARILAQPGRLADALSRAIAGFGRSTAQQLLLTAGWDPAIEVSAVSLELLRGVLQRAASSLSRGWFGPRRLDGEALDFSMWWLGDTAPVGAASASAVLDDYFGGHEQATRFLTLQRRLRQEVDARLTRQAERMATWQAAIAQASEAERVRELGDLLTAHMHLLQVGQKVVTVSDYFREGAPPLEIALAPDLSPTRNVQAYFKRYQKLRNAARVSLTLQEAGALEQRYLEQLAASLDWAGELRDLEELAAELASSNGKAAPANPAGRRPPQPLTLEHPSGARLLVGRNSRQNDLVTFKEARPSDWWLHTRDGPGCHVVIRSASEPGESLLREAALLAAWFSPARHSSQVAVVYTRKKHVKKIPGGPPGLVRYEQERTLFVTPDAERVGTLLALAR
ncbi:MAG: NFACT family protein [Candidatus Sericytochromatia bacterium]|nr:NFACT family protein [Candidatus Sericytochromatia bacterium]